MNPHQAHRLINKMISLGLDPITIIDKEKERQSRLRILHDTLGYKVYKVLEQYGWRSLHQSGIITPINTSLPHMHNIVSALQLIGIESSIQDEEIILTDEDTGYWIYYDIIDLDLLTYPHARDFSHEHDESYHCSLQRISTL
jgi:hypothetical protein